MAITSSYTLGTIQADGRTPVIEIHISDLQPDKVVRKEYLAHLDPQHPEYVNPAEVMQFRAERLNREEQASQRAALLASTGSFGLNKYEFRQLFTGSEQDLIDEFNGGGYLSHPSLTTEQKAAIRRGLAGYDATPSVQLDNPDTVMMVNLFEALGLIATGRAAEVLSGQIPA